MADAARQALLEGLADALGFFVGAVAGWQAGRVLGLDLLAPGAWTLATLGAWALLLVGCGVGKWAAERAKAWLRRGLSRRPS